MRAGGLNAGEIVRAEQLAWMAVSTGCWMAVVSMSLSSGNGRLRFDAPCHLVPPRAVIPAEPGQEEMTHLLFDKILQQLDLDAGE